MEALDRGKGERKSGYERREGAGWVGPLLKEKFMDPRCTPESSTSSNFHTSMQTVTGIALLLFHTYRVFPLDGGTTFI